MNKSKLLHFLSTNGAGDAFIRAIGSHSIDEWVSSRHPSRWISDLPSTSGSSYSWTLLSIKWVVA